MLLVSNSSFMIEIDKWAAYISKKTAKVKLQLIKSQS